MTDILTMAKVSVMVVNAFTYNGEGGNPAGVVLNADQYSQAEKQEIAKLAGFPETAFVSTSTVADKKLEFFTPNKQIAHCGHATVASFSYLNQIGEVTNKYSSKETIDGNRDIILEDGKAYMEQKPQFFQEIDDKTVNDVMASMSLQVSDIKEGFKPTVTNTGVSFMIIPLENIEALKKIKTDLDEIEKISEEFDLIGFYAFVVGAVDKGHDITSRMFAPRYAIPEEPATGMAAGNLSYYLNDKMAFKDDQVIIEQGYFMERPSKSEIIVNLERENGKLVKIMAGGSAKVMDKIEVTLR
ncbi:MAG: PhzF family phenazine biosynthesis protein [Emcibacteraceae bacterium]|nr:PhzF family phenazine biosynthesis protein [Emcibacteraceae bacterium]